MAELILSSKKITYYHNVYDAELEFSSSGNKIKPKMKNNISCKNFSKPETTSEPKIYIIKLIDNTIIYIGKANQSISTRLRQGLNPKHDTGYHGYKWKNIDKIKIHCITIPFCDDTELESIEAELVFNYRFYSGKWPLYQTEIHFHNHVEIKELAKKLYEIIN